SKNIQMAEWTVRIVTYNVAMKSGDAQSAEELVKSEGIEELLIIGLQEVAHGEQYGGTTPSWLNSLVKAVGEQTRYTLIGKTFQATNLLLIFVQRKHASKINRIEYRFAKNTLGGLTGHKGSIGAMLSFSNGQSIVLTLSHFVHDVSQLEARIMQYKGNKMCTFPEAKSVRASFWFGDLNFRIEGEQDEVKKKIDQGNLENLLERDQLLKYRNQGRVFTDYEEASIKFAPTYRFVMGSTDYDLKRTPSWCDRILYKGTANSRVVAKNYSRMDRVLASDHLPVQGIYNIPLADLPATQEWRISFHHIPTWYTSIPLSVRFRYRRSDYWKRKGGFTDWIGLFPARAPDLTNPIKWVFAMTCYTDSSSPPSIVAEFESMETGEYRVAYHSVHYNMVIGLSSPFKVIDPRSQLPSTH
ncbi:hypothetical protein PENTCL1PPCAC_11535, partial [Pristionchus entomophagus]